MGYSRMICSGNRVMVLFEGYTQEELAPILQTLNKLALNAGEGCGTEKTVPDCRDPAAKIHGKCHETDGGESGTEGTAKTRKT